MKGVVKKLVRNKVPFFLLKILDCLKQTIDIIPIIAVVVNVEPEVIDIEKECKQLTEDTSASWDFVDHGYKLILNSQLHCDIVKCSPS
jgi:hypothetical protein